MLTAFGFMGFDTNELSTANVATKNYDIGEKFDSIKIEDSDCNVQIANSTNGKCSVVFHGNDKMEIVPKVEDGVLNLEMNENRGWYKFIGLDYAKNDLLVYLPSDEYKDLKIKSNSTDSGKIFVPNFNVEDVCKVTTDSGDIMVNVTK